MAFGRTFLYHSTAPEGFIFDNEDKYLKALRDGWVEAPWLVGEVKAPPVTEEAPVPIKVPQIRKKKLPPAKPKKAPGRKAKGAKVGGKK